MGVLIFFVLAVFITHQNLGWEKTFAGEDYGVWYAFPERAIDLVYYAWDSFAAPGKINVTSMTGFLWININFLLYMVGIPPLIIERLIYLSFFFVSAASMYCLARLLIRIHAPNVSMHTSVLASFTAGLFYMINQFTMQLATIPITPYHLPYMLFPLLSALFIYNVQIKTRAISQILFVLCFSLLLGGNPSNILIMLMLLLFYFLFFYRDIRHSNTRPFRFFLFTAVVMILLTSYITLPALSLGTNPYGSIDFTRDLIISAQFNSQLTSFANLFFLGGYVAWNNFTYFLTYTTNGIFLTLGYGIFSLTVLSILLPGQKKIKVFAAIVLVTSLYFAKGTHPPFENVFSYMLRVIPFFGMFRSVYNKFAYLTTYASAILISFFVVWAGHMLTKSPRIRLVAMLVFPLAIMVYGYPFFTGELIQSSNGDVLTKIPQEYRELAGAIADDRTVSKVLALPPAPRGAGLILQWQGDNKYIGFHPDFIFLNRPVLDGYWYIRKGFFGLTEADSWTGTRFEEHLSDFLRFVYMYNIRYIFVHKDFVESYAFGPGSPAIIEGSLKAGVAQKFLQSIPNITTVKDTTYFTLYRLGDRYFAPVISAANSLVYADSDQHTLFDVLSLKEEQPREAVFLFDGRKTSPVTAQAVRETLPHDTYIQARLETSRARRELDLQASIASIDQPYVRWLPESFVYPLIRAKDALEEWSARGDARAAFDKELFFAQKRLMEFVANAQIHNIVRNDVRVEYVSKMNSLAQKAKGGISDHAALWRKKLEAFIPFHFQIVYRSAISEEVKGEIFSFLDDLERRIDKRVEPEELNRFLYDVDIPEGGTYDIFVSIDYAQWIKIESKNFITGQQRLVYTKGELEPYFPLGSEHPEKSIFFISFDYAFNDPTTSSRAFLRDDTKDELLAVFDIANRGPDLRHFETFFISASRVSNLTFHPDNREVENLRIERVYEPKLMLKRTGTMEAKGTPALTFQRINPTRYRIGVDEADDPFLLIFSESYNENWNAYIGPSSSSPIPTVAVYDSGRIREKYSGQSFFSADPFAVLGKLPLPRERHMEVNGYANGWLVRPEDAGSNSSYDIILEFKPQWALLIGFFISAVTYLWLFVSLMRSGIQYMRKKNS